MSYLNPIRLNFSGQFQADPSTVNNDVRHFNNATFQPQFQQPQSGTFMLNGWWEPEGSGAFRLVNCLVNTVCYADGSSSYTDPTISDPVIGMAIADANTRVAGKIVDLDPQQQMVSQIWGLIVRLTDGSSDYFAGSFDVASFSDIWFGRAQGPGAGGDSGASSFYQSVIGPVTWGDTSGSKFLQELKATSPDGRLSIKFNVDGYNMNSTSAAFTLGRIVGTIGPASLDEPRHFVLGRQLFPQVSQGSPAGPMNFMPAVVDGSTRKVLADFGNALPTQQPGGNLANLGDLQLGSLDGSNAFHSLGTLAPATYLQSNPPLIWYTSTAGIQAFPPDRALTDAELATLARSRLAVVIAQGHPPTVQENFEGLYLRADTFTFRRGPGETAEVELWATQYGAPLPNAQVVAFRDPSGLQPGIGDPNDGQGPPPSFATPPTAISFPSSLQTDARGRATLPITAGDPGNPRGYIDGQVYGVGYLLEAIVKELKADPSAGFDPPFGYDPADFVSLLVFDPYAVPPDGPTWYSLQPIWQQYANLYPIMGRLLNLAAYENVAAHASLLAFAFGLPAEDPNHMPVTRDLSPGKRAAILQWLSEPGTDGTPRLGQPPVPPRPPRPVRRVAAAAPTAPAGRPGAAPADPRAGAKAYAMSRRSTFRIPDNFDE